MKRLLLVLALSAACAGCTSTLTRLPLPKGLEADGFHPIETVEVSNATLLFLSCLPIASGDPMAPNSGGALWFEETTSLDNQMRMLEAEASRVGATRAVAVQTLKTDESFCVFLFKREKIHTSAVLVRDLPKQPDAGDSGGRDGYPPAEGRPRSGCPSRGARPSPSAK